MHRALGFRPLSTKFFVPSNEVFHTRQQLRRNAVLADVVGPSRLGHCPQVTIATDLAAKFGGLTEDFLVASCRERNYVILLPQWVRPEDLLRRATVNLRHCRLRCFNWNPYRNASRSRIRSKAWIKLMNLPFECWTESKVSSIVSSFGKFLRSDEGSLNMLDLVGFRCQIAVDEIADIPESFSLTMGDITLPVPVRLESTTPFGGEDRGTPFAGGDPNEGADQTDPLGRQLARRVNLLDRGGSGPSSTNGNAVGQGDSWDSSELRDRWRNSHLHREEAGQGSPDIGSAPPSPPVARRSHSPPSSGGCPKPLCSTVAPALGGSAEVGAASFGTAVVAVNPPASGSRCGQAADRSLLAPRLGRRPAAFCCNFSNPASLSHGPLGAQRSSVVPQAPEGVASGLSHEAGNRGGAPRVGSFSCCDSGLLPGATLSEGLGTWSIAGRWSLNCSTLLGPQLVSPLFWATFSLDWGPTASNRAPLFTIQLPGPRDAPGFWGPLPLATPGVGGLLPPISVLLWLSLLSAVPSWACLPAPRSRPFTPRPTPRPFTPRPTWLLTARP